MRYLRFSMRTLLAVVGLFGLLLWIVFLNQQGDPIQLRIRELSYGNAERRRLAADVLGDEGPRAKVAVPALIRALSDPVPSVRATAAESLGSITQGTDAAILPLMELLTDEDMEVRRTASKGFERR